MLNLRTMLGMTLAELMVGITIIGVVMALSVGSLFGYNLNSTIRDVAQEFSVGLRKAKIEAITRNTTVTFTQSGTGWTITLPPVGNAAAVQIGTRKTRPNESIIGVSATSAGISFNGQGMTTTVPSSGSEFTYTIGPNSSTSNTCVTAGGSARCLKLQISPGGRIKLCDPALPANGTDARKC